MIRSRRLRHIVVAAAAFVALTCAHEAAAHFSVTVKLKVELPPGVKGSDVKVETGSANHPDEYRLNDKGEVEFQTSGYDNDMHLKISGPNIYSRKLVWVESNQQKIDVVFSADELTTLDAYYDPEKVAEKGKAAAAVGDSAGVKAAADELEQGAKAVERNIAELRQALGNIFRQKLEGLPPGFVDDFIRDYNRALTSDDKIKVLDRYRNSATLKAPDAITSAEFRRGRDAFFKLAKEEASHSDDRYQREELERAAKARAYADQLRHLTVTPPGHGAVPQPAGTPPKFPGDTTPGVPGAPVQYAAVLKRDYWAQLGAGVAFFDATSIGYGTQRTGAAGTESYIAETSSHSTGYRLAADGGARLGDRAEIVGHAAYRHTDFEGNGFVPVGGATVATTYFDRAPNGSTGIDQGTNGANTSVHGTLSKYEADISYRLSLNALYDFNREGPRYSAGVGLGFRRFDLSYMARQTSPTFDGVHSKAWIDSTTNFIGPRIDSSVSFDVPAQVPFKIEIAGYVIPGFRWGDGRAKQRSFCDVCGADEQNLKIVVDRNRSGFGLVAGFTGRVSVELSEDLSLGVEGGYEYVNAVNTWKIPAGPFEAPADLATEPVKIGYVGVTLRLNF